MLIFKSVFITLNFAYLSAKIYLLPIENDKEILE